jgi:hypothetical protein
MKKKQLRQYRALEYNYTNIFVPKAHLLSTKVHGANQLLVSMNVEQMHDKKA